MLPIERCSRPRRSPLPTVAQDSLRSRCSAQGVGQECYSREFLNDIKVTSDNQKNFKSAHKYDLEKFGLTEERIKNDCAKIYSTFLN